MGGGEIHFCVMNTVLTFCFETSFIYVKYESPCIAQDLVPCWVFLLVRSLNYFLCEWFLSLRDSVFFDLISTHQVSNLRFLLLSWFFFLKNIDLFNKIFN